MKAIKAIKIKALSLFFGYLALHMTGCQDYFIDLDPPASFTDGIYFNKASDFKEFSSSFYGKLQKWDFSNMDNSSDLSANSNGNGSDIGQGAIKVGGHTWDYSGIRNCNILLARAAEYKGNDIDQFVGEAYFFRAYAYFGLLKTFGGVPIVTTVLDVNSPELFGKRNSRYEVVAFILDDLDEAIAKLPTEQTIPSSDRGRISRWAAKSFKAQVLLYEATWEKYVKQATDGDGVTVGAGTAGYVAANIENYLKEAITQCEDVMTYGGYELWNKNADSKMQNLSSWYLFNLEDEGSNPGGYTKTSNKEFILYRTYDYTHARGNLNLTWTVGQLFPSRKFVDMAVCADGLPPHKSPLFQGYHSLDSEFKDRDLRLLNYLYASTTPSTTVRLDFTNKGASGYDNNKFGVYGFGSRRLDNTESANYPIIRLAEVYLIYAEALVELNGAITDAQLDASINKLRDRAGVAHLTNELATKHGLDMKEEIRRERAVELYREGKRFDDLKRWGILEASLNASRLGRVVGDTSYATPFKNEKGEPTDLYLPKSYVWGEETALTADGLLKCVVVSSSLNHSVELKHYLYPMPSEQMILNKKLLQNPGYLADEE